MRIADYRPFNRNAHFGRVFYRLDVSGRIAERDALALTAEIVERMGRERGQRVDES